MRETDKTAVIKNIESDGCDIVFAGRITSGVADTVPGFCEIKNPVEGLPDFYRVCMLAHPGKKSNIKIEIWLPESWNGRLVGIGNGGIGGVLHHSSMKPYLVDGYAVTHTDLGTSAGKACGYGNDDVKEDYCHRATHLMTVYAKEIISLVYGRQAEYSYFCGSSTGGLQAYTEAQRYPDDYNGIDAGVPSIINTAYHTYYLWNYVHLHDKNHNPLISKDTFGMIRSCAVEFYQHLGDGEPGDNFVSEPYRRDINVSDFIQFLKNKIPELTESQLSALKAVYEGPKNPHTGRQICCGAPIGSEDGIANYAGDSCPGIYPFYWAFGGDFDPFGFDFADDFDRFDSLMGKYINAVNPSLRPFSDCGGKLLAFSGSVDSVVLYPETDIYYENVCKIVGGNEECMKFFRYFLLPGRTHTSGFGADSIAAPGRHESRAFAALVDWVEHNVEPEYLIAISNAKPDKPEKIPFERIIYPYGTDKAPFRYHPATYGNM